MKDTALNKLLEGLKVVAERDDAVPYLLVNMAPQEPLMILPPDTPLIWEVPREKLLRKALLKGAVIHRPGRRPQ